MNKSYLKKFTKVYTKAELRKLCKVWLKKQGDISSLPWDLTVEDFFLWLEYTYDGPIKNSSFNTKKNFKKKKKKKLRAIDRKYIKKPKNGYRWYQ